MTYCGGKLVIIVILPNSMIYIGFIDLGTTLYKKQQKKYIYIKKMHLHYLQGCTKVASYTKKDI